MRARGIDAAETTEDMVGFALLKLLAAPRLARNGCSRNWKQQVGEGEMMEAVSKV